MSIVADLHLHSKYSRAVSQKMDLFEIARWAGKKGINLCATGDWLHPMWYRHLKEELVEHTPGIFKLKTPPKELKTPVYYLLSVEIANIFSQGGKLRRVHNLIFVPSFDSCEKITKALVARGAKLMSDGRPVLGISSREILEMILSADKDCLLIPAHAWTPWFGQYGSKSGFDSIEESFGELSKYIYGIETGLSSDPLMNWQIKELEERSILSFSDAHSAPKMGREATVFVPINNQQSVVNNQFTYKDIADAIKRNPAGRYKIGFTIEFFPEEGKYHWSGHRACNIRYNAQEVLEKGTVCPVCGNALTVGVENRVWDLAVTHIKESDLEHKKSSAGTTFLYDPSGNHPPFVSAIPLLEIVTELMEGSPTKSLAEYERLTTILGTEFDILLKKPYEEIKSVGGDKLSDGIRKMRERTITIDPGYDGVFGHVSIFPHDEQEKEVVAPPPGEQQTLF